MVDQETVFHLYRRAQKFLALPLDEGIEPNDYGDSEASEAERLIAELAVALSAAVPHTDDTPMDTYHMREACALLLLDETATPMSIYTVEEADYGDGFVKVELDPSEVVVQCRLEFAKAIRSLQDEEAVSILDANCSTPTPKDTPDAS